MIYNVQTIGGINTKDATAGAADILSGKTAYVGKEKVTGSMPDNGDVNSAIVNGVLQEGYTSGGTIENLTEENIKKGIEIGGKIGEYSGGKLFSNVTKMTAVACDAEGETATITVGSSEIKMMQLVSVSTGLPIGITIIFDTSNKGSFKAISYQKVTPYNIYDITSFITHTVSGTTHTYELPYSYNKYSSYGLHTNSCFKFSITQEGIITFYHRSYYYITGDKVTSWGVFVYYD